MSGSGKKSKSKSKSKDKKKKKKSTLSAKLRAESADFRVTRGVETVESFDEMGLPRALLKGIYAFGFELPSAIQARGIVPITEGKDVIAQAQSGTGKTGTFCIGSLAVIDASSRTTQIIAVSPTRELATQSAAVFSALGDFMGVKAHACIGGKAIKSDLGKLQAGVHVVSGTPGRMLDMLRRNMVPPKNVKVLVLDEADEMLLCGAGEQIESIKEVLPKRVQVVLVSATLPRAVLEITEAFMKDPVKVLVHRDGLTLSGIKQYYVAVDSDEWKFDTLCALYDSISITQAVIFCNKKSHVDSLAAKMRQAQFTVTVMHGNFDQKDREDVMNEFRSGAARVLITTDIWARGLDVQQVSLVVNYDLPVNMENYIHRIGRSGRFGRQGLAINLITPSTAKYLRQIEVYYKTSIPELPADLTAL